jgi:hypothetical protein
MTLLEFRDDGAADRARCSHDQDPHQSLPSMCRRTFLSLPTSIMAQDSAFRMRTANPLFLIPLLLLAAMMLFALLKKLLKMAAIVANTAFGFPVPS